MSSSSVNSQPAVDEVVVEWAPFELAEGRDEAGLIAASAVMQREFLDPMPGFLRRDLLREGDSACWVDLVYWENIDAAMSAARAALESPLCAAYFGYMTLAGGSDEELMASVTHYSRVSSYAARAGAEA